MQHARIASRLAIVGITLLLVLAGFHDTVRAVTLTVTNLDDSGAGSLRQAIEDANAAAGADTITFDVVGTISLTSGQLAISDDLTITGPTAGMVIISGNNASRVFGIGGGVNVAISDVTITGGSTSVAGGIGNSGTLTLTNVAVSGNSTTGGSGGGIFNSGTLTVTSSTVSGNSAIGRGGGIYNSGTLTLTNSTVSGNSTTGFDPQSTGGGIFNSGAGAVTVTNSTISGNSATFVGGGFVNDGTASFGNTIIAGNSTLVMQLPDCWGDGPSATGTLVSRGHNLVQQTSDCPTEGDLTGNITGQDPLLGPLQDNGGPTFTHALLEDSPAIDAGDDSAAPATDQRGIGRPQGVASDIGAFEVEMVATFDLAAAIAAAQPGDTIDIPAGTHTVAIELVIDKDLTLVGAGEASTIIQAAESPDVADHRVFNIASGSTVAISDVTATNGSAVVGGGIYTGNSGTVSFKNTIIAGNSGGSLPDCRGTLTSQGHNLVQELALCTIDGDLTGNITGQDPNLGPLADNGGPTFTHALLDGSPAIDAGDDSVLDSPLSLTTDQRGPGFPRLSGAHVDIGAFERPNSPPVADAGGPYVIDQGQELALDGTASADPDAGDSIVSYEWDLDNDGAFDDASGLSVAIPFGTLEGLGLAFPADAGTGLPTNTIGLRVTDESGASDTDTTTLTIYDNRPFAVADANPNPAEVGQDITLNGSGSSHGSPAHSIVEYE